MMFNWNLLVGAANGLDVFGWMILLLWAVVGIDHVFGWCCSSGLTSFSGPACERCSVSTVSGTHLLPPTSHPPTFYILHYIFLHFTSYIFFIFTLYFNSVWHPPPTHLAPTHQHFIFYIILFYILHYIFFIFYIIFQQRLAPTYLYTHSCPELVFPLVLHILHFLFHILWLYSI